MGKPSVRMSRLRQRSASASSFRARKPADVGEAVLLGRHRAAVGQGEHLLRDRLRRAVSAALLADLDEVRVLGEAAGVEEEGLAVAVAQLPHAAQVLERDRLPAAGVVGDRHHHERHALAVCLQRPLEGGEVDVALEGVDLRRHPALGDDEVARLRLLDLHVGPRRVEVVVVGDDLSRLEQAVEEDALGGAALVGRDDVAEPGQVLDHVAEAEEGAAPRVGLVALHDRAPLRGRHRAGAGVGEEVDEHVLRPQAKDVVARLREGPLPVLAVGELDRLHRLDAERLDDRLEVQHGAPRSRGPV